MSGNSESIMSVSSDKTKTKASKTIFCANCIHCVLIKVPLGKEGQYRLRVRCLSKQWRKKLGEEKIYKFFTVARRTVDDCDHYDPMGELKSYLKDLRKSLPIKDELY